MAGKYKRGSKRSSEERHDSESNPAKRRCSSQYHELRILLPNKVAGAVIGRSGENIMRLRRKFLANISLPTCKGPERILTINARLSVMCQVLVDIIPIISVELNGVSTDENELRILVNSSQAGTIIGKSGKAVEHLKEKTGSQIKVFQECCPDSTEQVVQVRGENQAIIGCIRSILTALDKMSPSRNWKCYDPNNHDPVSAPRYGGFYHNETIDIKNRLRRDREKSGRSSKSQSETSKSSSLASSCISTPIDDSENHNEPKPVSATSIPSLLSIRVDLPENEKQRHINDKEKFSPVQRQLGFEENINNFRFRKGVQTSSLLRSSSAENIYTGSGVPSLLSLNSAVRGTHGSTVSGSLSGTPSPSSESTCSSAGSTTKDCLGQLLKAVSCLLESSMPFAAVASEKSGAVRSLIQTIGSMSQTESVVNGNCRMSRPVTTVQVGIPRELAGVVFQKENGYIRYLESRTSTKIWIDDVMDASPDCVIINVTGSPEQISRALQLLEDVSKSVRQRLSSTCSR